MKTSDFDYELPEELIAQTPVEPRDHSRLLVYHRKDRSVEHKHFYDIIIYISLQTVLGRNINQHTSCIGIILRGVVIF